jgi:class 3 adenylate cyclase
MDKDKLQELLQARDLADQELEKLKKPMTILFSDIKGSTAFAEKQGDFEYMKMLSRHNDMLFPVIEDLGGRVVKTLGDAILAMFDEPVGAIKAAAGMQRVLAKDREECEEIDQIRIRIGMHYGLGLIKDNDVFGDVVNAASRVQHQAAAEQILITDALLDAAKSAGFQCAKMGRADLKGKDEPIDLYAVAWSDTATQQLIEEVQARYEKQIKEHKRLHAELEEDFEHARDQWRGERRTLNSEIEELEEAAERARQTSREQLSEDLQSEIRFQLQEAIRSREQLDQELASTRQKFEAERMNFKAQLASMQASALDAMERSNNPARATAALREQVEERVAEAKQDWQLQWESERKRLNAEIDRLRKTSGAGEQKKEAARRAVLQKLGKVPTDASAPARKTADQWEHEFTQARIQWETERDQLNLKIRKLESESLRTHDSIRSEIFLEVRGQYDPKLMEAERERQQLELEIQSLTSELAGERQRLTARIDQLQAAIPEAQESARKQTIAELKSEYGMKVDEANRLRSRVERKQQDLVEEFEAEKRQLKKQVATLEEQLKEAKEAAFKAQKGRAGS